MNASTHESTFPLEPIADRARHHQHSPRGLHEDYWSEGLDRIDEHSLGQSTKQTVTVTSTEKVNMRGRTSKDKYTVTGTEDGIQRMERAKSSGDPW